MTIRASTLLTAGLLAGLMLSGSLIPAHAGDGCGTGTNKGASTGAPSVPADPAVKVAP